MCQKEALSDTLQVEEVEVDSALLRRMEPWKWSLELVACDSDEVSKTITDFFFLAAGALLIEAMMHNSGQAASKRFL